MVIQSRYFKAEEFLTVLQAKNLSAAEMATTIEDEIKRVEDLKISLVDEQVNNPSSVVFMMNDIDSYVYLLQDVLVKLSADPYSSEILSSEDLQFIRSQIGKLMKNNVL